MTNQNETNTESPKARHTGRWIAIGLLLGVACGLLFGDYCADLQVFGDAYVGLLQMTVLPYLVLSLIGKIGRLNPDEAKRLGAIALGMLLVLWLIAIVLVVAVSAMLPPIEGASFFSPVAESSGPDQQQWIARFIPTNVFRSLANETVPAVVVFCLFFGGALMLMPGKEPLLDFLDLCGDGIGRVNLFLVRLAPVGLFMLTAAAAGTMRLEEISRLQAYIIMLVVACLIGAFAAIPLLLTSLTDIRYRDLMRAAQEPLLTAIAAGKLFVVLPQIAEKCEQLLAETDPSPSRASESASVVVPLAYPFPHVGKILSFLFISFAAWYAGKALSPHQSFAMAATGAVSSFASPLVTMPYMLDQYQLPQDLMALFILPGFLTTRLGDIVGVIHLMVLTIIVTRGMQRRIRIHWPRLLGSLLATLACLGLACSVGHWYLTTTSVDYDLDKRFLALEITSPYDDVIVYRSRDEVPDRSLVAGNTVERLQTDKVLRVGYHPDHLPYSFFNSQDQLVGLDVELMYRLAVRLQVRLEFIPYAYDSVIDQLNAGEIDIAVGGLAVKPERLLLAGFTEPYQTATVSVVLPDYRRTEFQSWEDPDRSPGLRLGAIHEDDVATARRGLPDVEIVKIDSIRSYFEGDQQDLDGLIMAAEEGAAWNVLYPEHAVVVPRPILQRPVGMAVRSSDVDLLRLLDRWLDFERLDGSLDQLRSYWIEGGGTKELPPRWCILRDVLGWIR